jgi:hypothetical protein
MQGPCLQGNWFLGIGWSRHRFNDSIAVSTVLCTLTDCMWRGSPPLQALGTHPIVRSLPPAFPEIVFARTDDPAFAENDLFVDHGGFPARAVFHFEVKGFLAGVGAHGKVRGF